MRCRCFFAALIPALAADLQPVPAPPPLPVAPYGFEAHRGGAQFQFRTPSGAAAIDPLGISFSPQNFRWQFVAADANARTTLPAPLPGAINSYAGNDPTRWQTGLRRYARLTYSNAWPGVDVTYTAQPDGVIQLRVDCAAFADPGLLRLEITGAERLTFGTDGSLLALLRESRGIRYLRSYTPPTARQGETTLSAGFFSAGGIRLGIGVTGRDPGRPLTLTVPILSASERPFDFFARSIATPDGGIFVLRTVPDAAGKTAPYPELGWSGCADVINSPAPCVDTSVERFSPQGELVFATYLEGGTMDFAEYLLQTRSGPLIIAGTTDSAGFPVTADALQRTYGGSTFFRARSPDETRGDYFLSLLDPLQGFLIRSTYWGGPDNDRVGELAIGANGGIFIHPSDSGTVSERMPITRSALRSSCGIERCLSGYAVRFDTALSSVTYATYLPGEGPSRAQLGPDESLYYAATSGPGFPVILPAYQPLVNGASDAVLARLSPDGTKLLAATYWGTVDTDWILHLSVGPDGSAWAAVSSFERCCTGIRHTFLHFDPQLSSLLHRIDTDVTDLRRDSQGRLHVLTTPLTQTSPGAVLTWGCEYGYLIISPDGDVDFATNLPVGFAYRFGGKSADGRPLLASASGFWVLDQSAEGRPFAGCVVDSTGGNAKGVVVAGSLLTLFGSRLGPKPGLAALFENGRLPTALGGIRLRINGEPAPLLYVSSDQINFALPPGATPRTRVEVERDGQRLPPLEFAVVPSGLSFFVSGDPPTAVAINEDGSLNSATHPARPGSRLILYGSGGSAAVPGTPGTAWPLEARPMPDLFPVLLVDGIPATIDYAGAAPGLLVGVMQVNLRLPVPLRSGRVTVALAPTHTPAASYYPNPVQIYIN